VAHPEDRYEVANGLTMCASPCHQIEHGSTRHG
jgi:hypothetical protein